MIRVEVDEYGEQVPTSDKSGWYLKLLDFISGNKTFETVNLEGFNGDWVIVLFPEFRFQS